jgi:SAM-dependent methyltransferase
VIGPVRKVFLEEALAGSETEYWEHSWEGVRLDAPPNLQDPVLRIILRTLAEATPKDGLVLEAGCGSGKVVADLRRLGPTVVGVDLASRALAAARHQVPDLPLVAGDVSRFPFRDGAFHCVISLGVVEHFEQGPLGVLREHRRVLRDGGILLISVPRLSPVKRGNDLRRLAIGRCPTYRSRGRIVTRVPEPAAAAAPWRFHQYEFPRGLFRTFLEQAGFEVAWIRPCLVSAGAGESALIRRLAQHARSQHAGNGAGSGGSSPPPSGARPTGAAGFARFVRAAALREAGAGPLGRAITRVSQELLGHMDFACARAVAR